MAKEAKLTVVPRLRFPEFRKDSAWTSVELGQLAKFVTDRVGNTECTPYTVTSGVGLVSQQEKLGRTIAGNSIKNYVVLQRDDFAYNKSATKAFPQGFIARYLGADRAAVPNSIFTCFRVDKAAVNPTYLDYLFSHNLHGRWLKTRITVGARAHGSLNVNDDDLMALPVPLPDGSTSLDEQQKIADCLRSLDEVIAAQVSKVAALEIYKRGLMQEFFPRRGETLPRRRFPGYRDASEWIVRPLSEVAENLDNKRIPITESERIKGNVPYYGASGVVDYVKDYIFDENLLCVSEDGANLVARTYPIAFSIAGKTWVNNHAHVLRFKDLATQNMVESHLNSIDLRDFITGMAQPKLNRAMLDSIPIPLPEPAERRTIAGFLSSLEANLAGESDKLDLLRSHKKGLMQQLFPSMQEAL